MDREKIIINTSIKGIVVNIILVTFKAIVGFLANSIAIILDAVNNLSDALSSIITIIGTKLASKKPDKKHPYGHGRIEYFSSIIIAIIVLFAGGTALKESVVKIIHPEDTNYSYVSLFIVFVAIFVKLFFGKYVEKTGKKVNSGSLIASGKDAIFDSVLSLSTFITAIISLIFHISLEGIVGVVIALFIIKSSIEILKETVNDLIGIRIDSELSKKVKESINTFDVVAGTYDLNINTYGPNRMIGSCHIEIPDNLTASDIHKLTNQISYKIYQEYGIILTVGVYASNTSDKISKSIKDELFRLASKYKHILQIHGFYVDKENDTVYFDIVMDFEEENPLIIRDEIINILQKKYPKYTYLGVIDADLSD
ncbi:MAG: cation transporter [Bacilli bacterium]|nr:cation transporter [Bacilli bacterium]